MPPPIQPRTLKGFRDYLPEMMIPREWVIDTARRVYRSYGFSPIDTPALEYLDILVGKGSEETDKQLYRFQDHGGRDVGLRFDLTVPLARFAAQHIGTLGTPFKRYHIATVWRGENTQRGRYREFMQCDFDTIGTTSPVADAETILVMFDLLREIGFKRFTIRINDRTVLNGLLQAVGLADKTTVILRAIDKLPKIGAQKVVDELQATAGATSAQAQNILQLVQLAGSNDDVLGQLEKLGAGEPGVARLREVISILDAVPRPKENILKLDASIARGLDYYTGIVFETTLDELPDIGSVCSGGRYDNLAELYTNQQLPGIGGSLGLDRLLAAMEELKMIDAVRTPAQVFVPLFDETQTGAYFRLAATLRSAGIAVEVYPEPKKLGKQLQYADRRGFRVALVLGSDEFAAGQCQVKDLASGGSQTVNLDENATNLIAELRKLLAK